MCCTSCGRSTGAGTVPAAGKQPPNWKGAVAQNLTKQLVIESVCAPHLKGCLITGWFSARSGGLSGVVPHSRSVTAVPCVRLLTLLSWSAVLWSRSVPWPCNKVGSFLLGRRMADRAAGRQFCLLAVALSCWRGWRTCGAAVWVSHSTRCCFTFSK